MLSSSASASVKIASGKVFVGLVLVGVVVQFAIFYREIQRAEERARERELAIGLVKRRFRTIHSECEDNSSTEAADTGGGDGEICWQVMDLVSVRRRRTDEPQEDGDEMNRLIAERFLVGSASLRFFFSKVDLVVPRPLTSKPTKDWDLNTAQLSSYYLHAAILIPLTTGHLRLDDGNGDDSPLETVFVGIGGGSFSTYLQTRNHNWQILSIELDAQVVRLARQFFGLRDEENARETVRVGDGLAWIEETATKGESVDVVYMDANGEHAKDGFLSPLAALVDEDSELVAKLASVIRPNGLYFSNVLTADTTSEMAELQQRILRRYERHFAHCLIVDYGQKGFQLGCSHSSALDVKSASDRRADFLATAKNWYRRLGFESSLEPLLRIVTTA